MKLGVLVLVGVAMMGLGGLTGCETLTQTPGENWNMVARSSLTDFREIPDDTDNILLLTRGSWLSNKPVPQN